MTAGNCPQVVAVFRTTDNAVFNGWAKCRSVTRGRTIIRRLVKEFKGEYKIGDSGTLAEFVNVSEDEVTAIITQFEEITEQIINK
jgi:hypothetical protein